MKISTSSHVQNATLWKLPENLVCHTVVRSNWLLHAILVISCLGWLMFFVSINFAIISTQNTDCKHTLDAIKVITRGVVMVSIISMRLNRIAMLPVEISMSMCVRLSNTVLAGRSFNNEASNINHADQRTSIDRGPIINTVLVIWETVNFGGATILYISSRTIMIWSWKLCWKIGRASALNSTMTYFALTPNEINTIWWSMGFAAKINHWMRWHTIMHRTSVRSIGKMIAPKSMEIVNAVRAQPLMPAAGGSTSKLDIFSTLRIDFQFIFFIHDFPISCLEANLNGVYRTQPIDNNFVGIVWEHWLGDYSMKSTQMMIRPKIEWNNDVDGSEVNSNSRPPDDP